MPSKDFFIQRYRKLGWTYQPARMRQAIRVNTININETALIKRLDAKKVELEKIPFLSHGYWINRAPFSIGATPEYLLGYYSLQEAAAQIPVALFTALKDKIVLDACAAPGGKTIQLANKMQNSGVIVALDSKQTRLLALTNQLERCHVENTVVYHRDARNIASLNMEFDRILLDLPCSGNHATDKEWFKKRKMEDIKRNARLQREILTEAIKVLKDDGELVYSTCSLEPEENELNIGWALRNLNLMTQPIDCYGQKASTEIFNKKLDPAIKNCKRIWPGQTQGFFIAKFRKT